MTFKKKMQSLGVQVAGEVLGSLGLPQRPRARVAGSLFKILTAAAMGCAAGLLLAPRPGRELFRSLVKRGKSGSRSLTSWVRG